ncbi:tyrosine-type recombinase/integrase [Mycobacterium sp. Aquia_213]|uniref:tyrosine-type recombinase/integrase n=1 Tax=Mycobacterium sp. Aquia_213 TaxID=2991728 RepID=UPI00226FBC59|nr:tyrosine-type recombinase/integrase [Mycobacterium sp. Aquia_213]WAC92259.1 tyrosine-type recombinase/integrase [Mycobacterium sp. Aquia_213]
MATISSYNTAHGKRYRVRYRTPDRRQTDKRGFRTKREAEQFAATVEVTKLRGEYISPTLGRVTIGELGPAWLERRQGHMKPSGFRSYESAWRVHVEPAWGRSRVSEIRFTAVQGWVSQLAITRGPVVVQTAYSVLARILDDAVQDRLLASNPARGVKLPKRPPRRNVYLTAGQLNRLADESGRYRSLVLLLGVGGLRWGEAAALRVGDVNFLRRRIDLHRNAVQVGTRIVVGTLKSNQNRAVVLPEFVIEALAEVARGKGRDDLFWPTSSGRYMGPPASKDSWLSGAVARCRKADPTFPRVTAHALRHTAASLAISAGANPKVVQRMLGHASAAMTLDVYADLFDSDLSSVAESVGKLWARTSQSHDCSTARTPLPAPTGTESRSLLSGLN